MSLLIFDALAGKRGIDQERIAEVVFAWAEELLEKNRDYGSSVWMAPVLAPECQSEAAIRVRMSDKIQRLQTLISLQQTGQLPEVDESIEDTVSDLGAYCLLWLARPK